MRRAIVIVITIAILAASPSHAQREPTSSQIIEKLPAPFENFFRSAQEIQVNVAGRSTQLQREAKEIQITFRNILGSARRFGEATLDFLARILRALAEFFLWLARSFERLLLFLR